MITNREKTLYNFVFLIPLLQTDIGSKSTKLLDLDHAETYSKKVKSKYQGFCRDRKSVTNFLRVIYSIIKRSHSQRTRSLNNLIVTELCAVNSYKVTELDRIETLPKNATLNFRKCLILLWPSNVAKVATSGVSSQQCFTPICLHSLRESQR